MTLSMHPALNAMMKRGSDFLTVPYPILGGAMTWVSDASLVSAISESGGLGVLACGAMTPELLEAEIIKTKEKTTKPFGVNLILMHPKLKDLIAITGKHHIPFVILAGGIPQQETIHLIQNYGSKAIAFAPARIIAERLQQSGIDAIIIEGSEAGGHIGPVSTSVLVQEILPHIKDVPVFVAGGIGCGSMMVTYWQMGAAGCQLGTRFVCATESNAHPHFKKAFIQAKSRDAVSSVQLDPRFPVIPVRAIQNEASKEFLKKQQEVIQRYEVGEIDLKAGQLEIEHFWAGSLRRAVVDGDIKGGSLMAGQSVGMVTGEQSVADIMAELLSQANDYLHNINN